MDIGAYFASWDHRKTKKRDGGKVFITCSSRGEITAHEGYLSSAEAKRRETAEQAERGEAAPKPELTKPAQNYVDLHRHAAVRADLLGHTAIALRLIAAHMICGSDLWQVGAEPQKAAKPEIADSLATNRGQQAIETEREAIQALIAIPEGDYIYRPNISVVLAKLTELSDDDVLRVLTFLMAETLSVHSPLIDTLGAAMGTEMRDHWQPDQAFFDLIRDKQVLNAMVGEYAGEDAAAGNVTGTAKTQRAILTTCLDGTRTPADPNWTPRYMAFPQGSYRKPSDVDAPGLETREAA